MASKSPASATSKNDSTMVVWLLGVVAGVLVALVVGGFWMQAHNRDVQAQRQQEQLYRTYLKNTRPEPVVAQPAPAPAPEVTQARETREYLLAHPAVVPGRDFDKPGVQETGKAIAQAIDRAQSKMMAKHQ